MEGKQKLARFLGFCFLKAQEPRVGGEKGAWRSRKAGPAGRECAEQGRELFDSSLASSTCKLPCLGLGTQTPLSLSMRRY